ncbi:hypothetical protein EVAR_66875_1 [Eumeta japonica]|uniref:Uncharacterized protein n=1 Tax=Eumeta variegata TaxID=151549 RepID=A0A4C1ZXK5_EUMVA|nr:hypothetical protein EVAR_66875_1 [Eumeta japonica]
MRYAIPRPLLHNAFLFHAKATFCVTNFTAPTVAFAQPRDGAAARASGRALAPRPGRPARPYAQHFPEALRLCAASVGIDFACPTVNSHGADRNWIISSCITEQSKSLFYSSEAFQYSNFFWNASNAPGVNL